MHYYFGYDGSGNMPLNSRVSADYLGYDASQPHAVSSVRATEGSITMKGTTVTIRLQVRSYNHLR